MQPSPAPQPSVAPLPTISDAPLAPEAIAKRSLPSVILLVVNDKDAQPLAMGSGFVVKEEIIATNYHVIAGGGSALVTVPGVDKPLAVAAVLATDADQDLALLRVPGLRAAPLKLGQAADVDIGARVYAAGNPKGLQGTFSEGIVSAKRGEKTNVVLQITAPISPGSSGGPVLDKLGKVIGVATATLRDGQNLNFAVGAESLTSLMNSMSGEPKPFPTAKTKKARTQGESIASALTFSDFMWDKEYDFEGGTYTVSIRNKLNRPVEKVVALVVFYDGKQLPIETAVLAFDGVIPAGLARMARASVDGMMKTRVSAEIKSGTAYNRRPLPGRVELRLMDFVFAD